MMKKIYFKLLCTLFVAACSTLQAAEQHNGVITVGNQIREPQCICFLSPNCIAIGGNNGIQLDDKKGKLISKKFVNADFHGPIYQIVRGKPMQVHPELTLSWYAVDQVEYHEINTFENEIVWNQPHNGKHYFYFHENKLQQHKEQAPIDDVLLLGCEHSDSYSIVMRRDYPWIEKYHSLATNGCHVLAVLTHNNSIEFWPTEQKNQPTALLASIPLDQSEKLDESTEKAQRLSFSFDNLLLAVALKNKCFIISLLSQSIYYQKQDEAVCRLLLLLNPIQH